MALLKNITEQSPVYKEGVVANMSFLEEAGRDCGEPVAFFHGDERIHLGGLLTTLDLEVE
jgi:hypothetical protein